MSKILDSADFNYRTFTIKNFLKKEVHTMVSKVLIQKRSFIPGLTLQFVLILQLCDSSIMIENASNYTMDA